MSQKRVCLLHWSLVLWNLQRNQAYLVQGLYLLIKISLYPPQYLSSGRHSINACWVGSTHDSSMVPFWLSRPCLQSSIPHTSPRQLPSSSELLVWIVDVLFLFFRGLGEGRGRERISSGFHAEHGATGRAISGPTLRSWAEAKPRVPCLFDGTTQVSQIAYFLKVKQLPEVTRMFLCIQSCSLLEIPWWTLANLNSLTLLF